MFETRTASRRLGRYACMLVLAIFCLGATAASAVAAKLKVQISPTSVKRNHTFTITVSGKFKAKQNKGTVAVDVYFQSGTAPCKKTAKKEAALGHTKSELLASVSVASSPFSHPLVLKAGTIKTTSRICGYLDTQKATGGKVHTLKKASATYKTT